MIFTIAVLFVSIALLVKSSEIAIRASVRLSKLLGISHLAVGFFLIAVATSFPELSIAVISSLEGQGELGMGNILGSNIADLALIFGAVAFFGMKLSKNSFKEIFLLLGASSFIVAPLIFLDSINWLFGAFCLVGFLFYSKFLLKRRKHEIKHEKLEVIGLVSIDTIKTFFRFIFAIVFVLVSAKFATDSAVELADAFNVAETLIGATVLALGTTLPELAISIKSLRRNDYLLAVGASTGSVIIKLTLVLGIASIINPISLNIISKISAVVLLSASAIVILLASRMRLEKVHSIILLFLFAVFMVSLFYAESVL